MGRADNPVRRVLNYASDNFARHLPIVYALTVVAKNDAGDLVTRGLFVGDDVECFLRASELSLKVQLRDARPADPQGRGVPRPGGIQEHLARQQDRSTAPAWRWPTAPS